MRVFSLICGTLVTFLLLPHRVAVAEDAGTGVSTGLLPEQYQAADFRQGHASTGPSSWKGSPHVAIPEPAASDAVADLRAEHPESCEPPGIDQLPQNKRRRAPTRRKPLPELGTNISKSTVKPRKKARQKTTNALVPQSASVEHDCSTAMVACEADVDHADQPMAVSNSVVNQYDEMTRALCAGKVRTSNTIPKRSLLAKLIAWLSFAEAQGEAKENRSCSSN